MKGTNERSGLGAARAKRMRLAAVTATMLVFSLMAAASPAGAGEETRPEPKVTICHAAGLEGTTHYNTLTVGYSAVYGPAGHFYENGTPQAGHEQDYLGECKPEVNEATLTIVKYVRSTDQEVPRASFPFVIAADGETAPFALADGGSKSFDFVFDSERFDVVVGELTGELEEGFSFVSASCAIGDREIAQGSRASVSLLDGADVTCTFVNRYDKTPEDTPSVTVKKEVVGDSGAKTTSFDILVGTRDRNVTMAFEDGGSHTFLPLAGTKNFGIAEQPIEEDGWSTAISCVSDERKEPFGSRGSSLVIEEIGTGEDIVCTVINTYEAPEDTPSVTVKKEVVGDSGAKTTSFDILVGTRDRNVTMAFEDGGSHTFLPLEGTKSFGIAEQPIEEDGWSTAISCVSDERKEPFGSRGSSLVIEEIGDGEDIVCTVINTYEEGETPTSQPASRPTPTETGTPCFDNAAENEVGECVKPEPPQEEAAADDVVVLGVQIEATTTTVEAVTADTLPFTGDGSSQLIFTGLLTLVAGALLLGGSAFRPSFVRGGRHERPSATFSRWVNR